MAFLVEEKVIRTIKNKRNNACLQCAYVFTENDLIDDDFISLKSQSNQQVFQPCKSTVHIILIVEEYLKKYENHHYSFESLLTHMLRNVDVTLFYECSAFGEDHDHQCDLVRKVMIAYLDIKSIKTSRLITRLTQEKLIRHEQLKHVHRCGQ